MGRPTNSLPEQGFPLILGFFALISFLRGFRIPRGWAPTQFSFNYSAGFIRRGLVGEVVRRLGGDAVYRYRVFAIISFIVLFGSVASLYRVFARARASGDPEGLLRPTALVFAASPALVMYFQDVGYLDVIGFWAMLGLILLVGSRRAGYLPYALVVLGGAVLASIHEVLIALFGPVTLFLLICRYLRANRDGEPGLSGFRGAVITLLALGGSMALALAVTHAIVPNGVLWELRRTIYAKADYPPYALTFDSLSKTFLQNYAQVIPEWWSSPFNRSVAINQLLVAVPTLAFALIVGFGHIVRLPFSRPWRGLLVCSFTLATLGPLALTLVAWDSGRWITFACADGLCCVLTMHWLLPATSPRLAEERPVWVFPSTHWLVAGVACIAVNFSSNAALFHDFPVCLFPYEDQIKLIWLYLQFGLGLPPGV